MRSLLSSLLAVLFFGTSFSGPVFIGHRAEAIAAPIPINLDLGTLPGLGKTFAGHPPENLGLRNGQLGPCPESPNCVLSQHPDEAHAIEPISYTGEPSKAQDTLLKVLSVVPRTTVLESTDSYIRVEFQTQLMGFVDDGEFYFPPDQKIIHVRSASRLGESDLNLNRRRIEQIRLAMADLQA